ncbi:hypothetical protein BJI67_03155 [Acidihalobacter aeolianus]|uniref:Helicase ATP-binding domain-containing protein n=2 Tax=Acidihalobacter aeolianus TaxID=2792603 RepID=A0A1D8K5G0_9GAMM|nr:hypothetical protein BJI67_03155 [Acidihalobacter aeolianus]
MALSAQLVDLEDREVSEVDDADVIVLTPEKADLLLRIGADLIESVALVVVDEAHHLEAGTRGALLELYLWRLKSLLANRCRFVFLSAVAPNIGAISKWIDKNGDAAVYNNRATRMRVGIYKTVGSGASSRGQIRYADGSVCELDVKPEKSIQKGICQLAEFLQRAGPVLIVAKGKRECEKIAKELESWLSGHDSLRSLNSDELQSDTCVALDASLEREMYADVELRQFIKSRIAYHHAGLPPTVRMGVERAIRERHVDYVLNPYFRMQPSTWFVNISYRHMNKLQRLCFLNKN